MILTIIKKFILGMIFSFPMIVFSSCSDYNPAYNRENIKATWIAEIKDGVKIADCAQRKIYSFNKSGSVILSGKKNMGDGNYKWGESTLSYSVTCCVLDVSGTAAGIFDISDNIKLDMSFDIVKQKDSLLIITPTKYLINEQDIAPDYTNLQMRKIPSKYASVDSISGVWEVKSRNGVSYNAFRVEFSDKNFAFYYKDSFGNWSSRAVGEEGADFFNLYYDFLAFTLYDNLVLGTSSKWSVSCFDIIKASPYEGVLDFSSENDSYHLELVKE
jgi:hypothetical protein